MTDPKALVVVSDSDSNNHHHEASPMVAVEVNSEGDVCCEVQDDEEEEAEMTLLSSKQQHKQQEEEEEDDLDQFTDASDLSDLSRRIWIVTTAGLPWMTGTAVNPLLRALSLAEHREKDHVTLMIPWLPSAEARKALYGAKHIFASPSDQEAWIRKYCVERCNCTEEVASKLRIQFWKGVYQESFGSIFPLDDICSSIPRDEADICILEEPEHLNWFRVPAKPKTKPALKQGGGSSSNNDSEQGIIAPDEEQEQGTNKASDNSVAVDAEMAEVDVKSDSVSDDDIEILGWSHKFRHVVGILHTNYADYIRQYGMASMVTAPALNSLSSLVVKAYCHKVIRLSATLPHLDATKEVTCNVHGVRHEFLERPIDVPQEEEQEADETKAIDGEEEKSSTNSDTPCAVEEPKCELAPVYFIGKLIWAKGFEHVLELEEKFKEATGQYFAMDVYGGGKDEKEIKTAFFGRHGTSRAMSSVSQDSDSSSAVAAKEADQKAAAVFGSSSSLRDQLCGGDTTMVDDDYVLVVNTDQEAEDDTLSCTTPGNVTPTDASTSVAVLLATPNVEDVEVLAEAEKTTDQLAAEISNVAPLEVLGDLSGKTLTTSADTADATLKLIESVMKAGFAALAGGKDGAKTKDGGEGPPSPKKTLPFHIAPAKTRFKWRRNSVPARFLGVQDHIVVRDIPEHKIFLNMSTSEVLCTTSAEALAMGKFVILPKHPSNAFFLQFPNCLAYETMDECVAKLQDALENNQEPLSETHIHALSWEGATERLIKASGITKRAATTRKLKGLDKADTKAAQFHVDAGKKSDWLRAKILK